MSREQLRRILKAVVRGDLDYDQALERLNYLPFEDLGFAKIDQHRNLRRDLPEVVFGEGKTADQIVAIGRRIAASGSTLIVTRLATSKARAVKRKLRLLRYHPEARLGALRGAAPDRSGHGIVMVISAGTSDLSVAEEAALCAELLGNDVERIYDVGVAGLPRLLANLKAIRRASVVIVVAGMEGALPSVVAGLIEKPVIAVPTSVGYGASFGGIAALLGMLNSCAGGVTVVNIDNGFGAALQATLINRLGSAAAVQSKRTRSVCMPDTREAGSTKPYSPGKGGLPRGTRRQPASK